MSNPILDAMAVEYESGAHRSNAEAMRTALLFLADNVSDEMVYAYLFAPHIRGKNVDENVRKSISAAIRAAAGEEGK